MGSKEEEIKHSNATIAVKADKLAGGSGMLNLLQFSGQQKFFSVYLSLTSSKSFIGSTILVPGTGQVHVTCEEL